MQLGKHTLKGIAVGVGAVMSLGHSIAANKTNIILIITDQQTANAMSNRGNPYLYTPAMDQLAADGVTFTNAYCAYPLSGPSRASLFTGKMPNEVIVRENNDSLPDSERLKSLGFAIGNAGYECLYAGKWHVPTVNMPDDGSFGFKMICEMNDPEMATHIDKALSERSDKPFFLVASYLNPHEACEYARSQTLHYGAVHIPDSAIMPPLPPNFDVSEDIPELVEIHKNVSPKLYPTKNYTIDDWKRYLYAYNRLVERVDKEIDKLLKILKGKKLYDNTTIIFTSDHGDGVAAHHWNQKRVLFEETINIPLIVKPNKNNKAVDVKQNSSLINIGIDIYPTICEYAQANIPDGLKGISLKKMVEGTAENSHKSIFVETNLDGLQGGRGWAVIKGDYKYIYYRFFKNREQLFNLKDDKGEMHNLIGNAAYKHIHQAMKEEMLRYGKRTNDKILIKELDF